MANMFYRVRLSARLGGKKERKKKKKKQFSSNVLSVQIGHGVLKGKGFDEKAQSVLN